MLRQLSHLTQNAKQLCSFAEKFRRNVAPTVRFQDSDLSNLSVVTRVGAQFFLAQRLTPLRPREGGSMMSIVLIGVALALLICAILAKLFANERKANKSERAEIMERLLALSEQEKKTSRTVSSVRLRPPLPTKRSQLGNSAAIRSNK